MQCSVTSWALLPLMGMCSWSFIDTQMYNCCLIALLYESDLDRKKHLTPPLQSPTGLSHMMYVGHSLRWVSIYGEVLSVWSSGLCVMASVGILQHSSAGRYFPFVVLTFKPGSDQNGISITSPLPLLRSILLAVQKC